MQQPLGGFSGPGVQPEGGARRSLAVNGRTTAVGMGAGQGHRGGLPLEGDIRHLARSWSGSSNHSLSVGRLSPQQQQQQQQQRMTPALPPGHQVFRSSSSGGSGGGSRGGSSGGSSRTASGSGSSIPHIAQAESLQPVAAGALDTIYEGGESEGVDGSSSDPSHMLSGTEGYTTGDDTAGEEVGIFPQEGDREWQQTPPGQIKGGYVAAQVRARTSQQQQQRVPAPPPPAPPLSLSKLKDPFRQQQQQMVRAQEALMQQRQQQQHAAHVRHSLGPGAIAAAAAASANQRAVIQHQQQMAAAAAAAAVAQQRQEAAGVQDAADVVAVAASAAAAAAAAAASEAQGHSMAATAGFLNPQTPVNLSAVTQAVAARLQHQQQGQFFTQPAQTPVTDSAPQRQRMASAAFSQAADAHTLPGGGYGSVRHASVSPTAAAVRANDSSWERGTAAIDYGSGSGGASATVINPSFESGVDTPDGWGRKSLAGLYNSSAGPSYGASNVPRASLSAAAASSGGEGRFVGDYHGLPRDWVPPATGVMQQLPGPRISAAASSLPNARRSTLHTAGLPPRFSQQQQQQLHTHPFASAGEPGRPSLRFAGTSSTSISSGSSSNFGVVNGEYIIPSVLRVVTTCPEARGLTQQLNTQEELTPHQRCLALLRWAYGVYKQLPREARTVSGFNHGCCGVLSPVIVCG